MGKNANRMHSVDARVRGRSQRKWFEIDRIVDM